MAAVIKTTVRIEGGPELAARLRAMPRVLSELTMYPILVAGAEPIRSEIARRAPHEPGQPDIRDHIVVSRTSRIGSVIGGAGRSLTQTEFAVAIGPAAPYFYGLFQEYGTRPHEQPKRKAQHPGHQAQPFMRPGFDAGSTDALRVVQERIWPPLEAQAARAA